MSHAIKWRLARTINCARKDVVVERVRRSAKRIVLTGVSRGLGLAMAEGFIEPGHTVFGCARSEEAIAELRKRWPAPHRFERGRRGRRRGRAPLGPRDARTRWAASTC